MKNRDKKQESSKHTSLNKKKAPKAKPPKADLNKYTILVKKARVPVTKYGEGVKAKPPKVDSHKFLRVARKNSRVSKKY
ncbi:MAG: hypothetical protein NUV70_06440 [Caldiserica bacterium]|nr:hypothetical protein [Caldisericota bacterium]